MQPSLRLGDGLMPCGSEHEGLNHSPSPQRVGEAPDFPLQPWGPSSVNRQRVAAPAGRTARWQLSKVVTYLTPVICPTSNHCDSEGTYHAGEPGHGVARWGLEALGTQVDLEVLEVPSFQGCLQLLAGQGVLGVPVGLQ